MRCGTPFDPRQHEAVVNVPGSDLRDGEIVEEVGAATGCERVIRPALVAVASGGSDGRRPPTTTRHSA